METSELLKKVRKIEIKSKGLTNQIFSGEYHSAFKGRGMVFSEVREYMPGDDIRTIDWNVTARFNHPFVKVFEEERELTVMLLADVSASESFGTSVQDKRDMLTEISAVLAFSAIQNNDKIGLILFSDRVEKFIPPKKGRQHILRIIRELLDFEPDHPGTDIGEALRFLTNAIKKKSTVFVLSDFMDEKFSESIKIANRKHDLVGIHIYDRHETEIPDLGIITVMDSETGKTRWLDTSSEAVRKGYRKNALKRHGKIKDTFRKAGVDFTSIATHKSYVIPLMTLFKKRENRR